MKTSLFIIALFISLNVFSQTKFITKNGVVNFEASVPSFEEVKATNNAVTAIINSDNGEFAALVLVKGFRFKNALMEEHFNENYAESDKYPKATFKGKIQGFSLKNLETTSEFHINGELFFHGQAKQLNDVIVKIFMEKDIISMSGNVEVLASDFDIKIPKIVSSKIAENIDVMFDFQLNKK